MFKIFLGITGSNIRIDQNGDSEGNFSVLALKESQFSTKDTNFTCDRHMIAVATFRDEGSSKATFPVSDLYEFFWFSN